jgi:hypothetical protein
MVTRTRRLPHDDRRVQEQVETFVLEHAAPAKRTEPDTPADDSKPAKTARPAAPATPDAVRCLRVVPTPAITNLVGHESQQILPLCTLACKQRASLLLSPPTAHLAGSS